jgi:hypothetical protein
LNPTSDLYHSIWNRFDQLRSLAGNVRVLFEVKVGETIDAILDVATHEHSDLIVLAGRNHLASFYQVHGRVSESLIRRAPCSVLLLRHFHAGRFQGQTDERGDHSHLETDPGNCDAEGGVVGARW